MSNGQSESFKRKFILMGVINFKQTKVYKIAFEQAMEIFSVTKGFSKEETYSLIDQIRRSSRM